MSVLKNDSIIKVLRCPICDRDITIDDRGCGVVGCNGKKRHFYDFASTGYVNLASPSQSNGGDSKQAVRARTAFLDTNHYAPILEKIVSLLNKYCSENGVVIDAGCGEGYYSNGVLKAGFSVIGFDLSKHAVEYAAKRAKKTNQEDSFFGVSSVFSLPVADNSVDAVINVFAPCAEKEYCRVMKDNGVLIVVHAGKEHLLGLKGAIYDMAHINEERADMPSNMKLVECDSLKYQIMISGNENIKNLFAMTPYYWKTSPKDTEKLEMLQELTTDIDISFSVYKKY